LAAAQNKLTDLLYAERRSNEKNIYSPLSYPAIGAERLALRGE